MVILVAKHGLIELKIIAIQTSNPFFFETVAFRFKIFNKQIKQKKQNFR